MFRQGVHERAAFLSARLLMRKRGNIGEYRNYKRDNGTTSLYLGNIGYKCSPHVSGVDEVFVCGSFISWLNPG